MILRTVPTGTLFVRLFVGRPVTLGTVPTETLFVRLVVGRLVILRTVPNETLFVRLFVGRLVNSGRFLLRHFSSDFSSADL